MIHNVVQETNQVKYCHDISFIGTPDMAMLVRIRSLFRNSGTYYRIAILLRDTNKEWLWKMAIWTFEPISEVVTDQ